MASAATRKREPARIRLTLRRIIFDKQGIGEACHQAIMHFLCAFKLAHDVRIFPACSCLELGKYQAAGGARRRKFLFLRQGGMGALRAGGEHGRSMQAGVQDGWRNAHGKCQAIGVIVECQRGQSALKSDLPQFNMR